MLLITFYLLPILLAAVIFLDVRRKINLTYKGFMAFFLIALPHISIIIYLVDNRLLKKLDYGHIENTLTIGIFILFTYIFLKVNLFPRINEEIDEFRVKILIGGRRLVLYSLYSGFTQIIFYLFLFEMLKDIPKGIIIIDTIIAAVSLIVFYINGMARILITSKRLNIIKKIIAVFTMLIPVVNIPVMVYACGAAKEEIEHECYRVVKQNIRIESQVCNTKYPLVMIHGIGFKDYKYINYWGRIPKELIKNGAKVYYGNQEAFGTVEYNAQDIKNKIFEIMSETGCEKVNIIAHSKGGLDARYMISKLGMEDYVASVTLMCVPNQGSKIIDFIYWLPKWFYGNVGKMMDKYFRMIGDKNPDFFTSTRQLSTHYCKKFNEEVKDSHKVYYQSYATSMNNMFSDYILTIPYLILKVLGGENDGLVEVESAKWGEFKGVIRNCYNRGISHGDIIDLRKDSYKGFDVREKYIEIVSDLKSKGY
ncbi:MAG TPA: triacylglycerol lipase [Pseudobacteroides sp.]|nr:triacylglycerol lipase [Pseudobacteroides sp.]